MTAQKQVPRFPNSHNKLEQIKDDSTARIAKFTTDERFHEAQQFCTRYRLAASFDGIKLQAFARDLTAEAYGAIFRVFLCYTALEMMLRSMGIDEKSWIYTLTDPDDIAILSAIEDVAKSRDFLVRLRGAHDANRGRAMIAAITGYLKNGDQFTAVMYAKAIRNAFAHGRLPSAPGNVGPSNIVKICSIICDYLLKVMNDEFDMFMS